MNKVHFGCGSNILHGWDNTNFPKVDVTKTLPYTDNTVDFIFHEHLLEHLDEVDGFNFLTECYRILKPQGVMRISCPSADGIIWVYQNWDKIPQSDWTARHENNKNKFINNVFLLQIAGYTGKCFKDGRIQQISNSQRWHKYLDDRQSLSEKLIGIGFSDVYSVQKHQSAYTALRGLERRVGGKFSDFPPELDMTLEAQKI